MGKGQAQKRRLANALKANEGNLHKAQFRKATKSLPLPNAPTEKDFQEKLPASLRRLQLLKAVAAGERPTANAQKATKKQQLNDRKNAKKGKGNQQQQPQQQQQPAATQQPEAAQKGSKKDAIDAEQPAQKLKVGQDAPLPYQEPEKESAGKARKKQYMRQKDKRKKAKVADSDLMVEKELELKQRQHATTGKFGEQAHAPPVVNLKRKHWDPQAAQAASSERCKRVFAKQMEDAQRRAAGLADGVSAGVATGGLQKQKALAREERDELRQKVIAAYREQRQAGQQQQQSSTANLETLAQLVRRNKEKDTRE